MFNEDSFAHIVFNQPPNAVDKRDESGFALGGEGPRSRQIDADIFQDASGPARKHENAVGEKTASSIW